MPLKIAQAFQRLEKKAISLLEKSLLKTFQITKYQVKMLFSNVDTDKDMLRVHYTQYNVVNITRAVIGRWP